VVKNSPADPLVGGRSPQELANAARLDVILLLGVYPPGRITGAFSYGWFTLSPWRLPSAGNQTLIYRIHKVLRIVRCTSYRWRTPALACPGR
jgi:hypothetical protein